MDPKWFGGRPVPRRSLLAVCASGAASIGTPAFAGDANAEQVPWQEIGRIAHDFVARESPSAAFPFESAHAAKFSRMVFAHYFPFFALSYENAPLDSDHWAQFLSRGGEAGKWAFAGGFTRERPLTPPPWRSPYWRQINAAIDIARAQLIGIDGFGVDLTRIDGLRDPDQAKIIYDSAAALAPNFYLVLEPDGDILKSATSAQMASLVLQLATSPNIFKLPDGRPLLVPFGPNAESPEYWQEVVMRLEHAGQKVAFVPDLVGFVGNYKRFASISPGMSFWGPRDRLTATSRLLQREINAARADGKIWMQPVTPQDARPKNMIFWEAENTTLFRTLWQQAMDYKAKYVHIITWNAYAEATQIAPSSGTQFLFNDLAAYYIAWFKTGVPPVSHQLAANVSKIFFACLRPI
jgi:hypothetical protein